MKPTQAGVVDAAHPYLLHDCQAIDDLNETEKVGIPVVKADKNRNDQSGRTDGSAVGG